MGTIKSKIGRKFEQKRKAKRVKEKQIWSRPNHMVTVNYDAWLQVAKSTQISTIAYDNKQCYPESLHTTRELH